MNISPACSPPIQPTIADADRAHPLYSRYLNYRAQLSAQLVTAIPFASWAESVTKFEQGYECVFHTLPGAPVSQGWYKHVFLPMRRQPIRLGPFDTEGEAKAAIRLAPLGAGPLHPEARA